MGEQLVSQLVSQLAGWQAEQQVRQLAGRPAEPLSGRPEGCLVIMPAGRTFPWTMGRKKAEPVVWLRPRKPCGNIYGTII